MGRNRVSSNKEPLVGEYEFKKFYSQLTIFIKTV
jgi:hypothetical protein